MKKKEGKKKKGKKKTNLGQDGQRPLLSAAEGPAGSMQVRIAQQGFGGRVPGGAARGAGGAARRPQARKKIHVENIQSKMKKHEAK